MRSISISHKHQRLVRQQVLDKEIESIANKTVDYMVKKRKYIEMSQECDDKIIKTLTSPTLDDHLLGASLRDMVASIAPLLNAFIHV